MAVEIVTNVLIFDLRRPFQVSPFRAEDPREVRYNALKWDKYLSELEYTSALEVCGMCLSCHPYGKNEINNRYPQQIWSLIIFEKFSNCIRLNFLDYIYVDGFCANFWYFLISQVLRRGFFKLNVPRFELIQRLCHLKVPDKEYRVKINILNIFCRIMIPIIKTTSFCFSI